MASGRVHSATTVFLGGASVVCLYAADIPPIPLYAVLIGCLIGLVVTPDLDKSTSTISHRWIKRSLGLLPVLLWKIYWSLYAKIIPVHRHWLSHIPIIGTLIRVVYVSPLLYLINAVLYKLIGFDIRVDIGYSLFALIGLIIADTGHWVLDKFPVKR